MVSGRIKTLYRRKTDFHKKKIIAQPFVRFSLETSAAKFRLFLRLKIIKSSKTT
jgi:hypothetical protein